MTRTVAIGDRVIENQAEMMCNVTQPVAACDGLAALLEKRKSKLTANVLVSPGTALGWQVRSGR